MLSSIPLRRSVVKNFGEASLRVMLSSIPLRLFEALEDMK